MGLRVPRQAMRDAKKSGWREASQTNSSGSSYKEVDQGLSAAGRLARRTGLASAVEGAAARLGHEEYRFGDVTRAAMRQVDEFFEQDDGETPLADNWALLGKVTEMDGWEFQVPDKFKKLTRNEWAKWYAGGTLAGEAEAELLVENTVGEEEETPGEAAGEAAAAEPGEAAVFAFDVEATEETVMMVLEELLSPATWHVRHPTLVAVLLPCMMVPWQVIHDLQWP